MVRGTLLRGGLEHSEVRGQAACVSSEKLDSFSDTKPRRQDLGLLIEQQGQNGWNTLEEGKDNRKRVGGRG